MTINPVNEGDDADLGSLSIDALDNGVAGDGNNIDRVLGADDGQVVDVRPVKANSTSVTTSSSTYGTDSSAVFTTLIPYDNLAEANAVPVFAFAGWAQPGTDETIYARLKNIEDGEVMTGTEMSHDDATSSLERVWSGWTEYTPTTTASPLGVNTEVKTDPGSNSSTWKGMQLFMGVKLDA